MNRAAQILNSDSRYKEKYNMLLWDSDGSFIYKRKRIFSLIRYDSRYYSKMKNDFILTWFAPVEINNEKHFFKLIR